MFVPGFRRLRGAQICGLETRKGNLPVPVRNFYVRLKLKHATSRLRLETLSWFYRCYVITIKHYITNDLLSTKNVSFNKLQKYPPPKKKDIDKTNCNTSNYITFLLLFFLSFFLSFLPFYFLYIIGNVFEFNSETPTGKLFSLQRKSQYLRWTLKHQ